MTLNPIKRLAYQIYLLQLENYSLMRYLGLWREHISGPSAEFLKPIVWTKKLKLTVWFAAILGALDWFGYLALFGGLNALSPSGWAWFTLAIVVVVPFVFFLYLALAVLLLLPIDWLLKGRVVDRAKAKLGARSNPLTIIGIAGSYGKTSMKGALETVLSEGFKVQATPDSVNTPIGISRFVLDSVGEDTEVLVVEMGAYKRGDIATLTEITKPDVAVLCGLNEAHIERFGGLKNTIAAKFEVVDGAKKDAYILLNYDDKDVTSNADSHIRGRKVGYYSSDGNEKAPIRVERVRLDTKRPGLNFILSDKNGRIGEFALPHLGRYVVGLVSASILVGRHLGMDDSAIKRGVEKIEPVEHRLKFTSKKDDIFIIDDSYNGNPDGVEEAIVALKEFSHRRRVYVTPGLVEMGKSTREVHQKIGEQLYDAADLVVLIKNSVTPHIAEALMAKGYPKEKIIWFASGREMYAALPSMLKAGDVVLFQNDWPENYT